MACWKARDRLPVSAELLIEIFRQLSRLRRYERILIEIVVFERRVGHFEHKYQGKGGRSLTTLGVRKLDSLGYRVVLFAWSYV